MLYQITIAGDKKCLRRIDGTTLRAVGLLEKDLETLVFENIQAVIRSSDLFSISHSRNWREEPDILALDAKGHLYIFELKAWESHPENLLQVMRYAQIYCFYQYDRLNWLWKKFGKGELLQAHQDYFGLESPISENDFNSQQVLVVMTNGLDSSSRAAIKYWSSKGVEIKPWIYRVYSVDGEDFISFEAFGSSDDPYEDAPSSFHIVNTCIRHGEHYHDHMVNNRRASAYNNPWKYSIKNIAQNDYVFLYQNSVGLIAYGKANSTYRIAEWEADDDEEYYVELDGYRKLEPPISASELRELSGYQVPLLRTYTSIRKDAGDALIESIRRR